MSIPTRPERSGRVSKGDAIETGDDVVCVVQPRVAIKDHRLPRGGRDGVQIPVGGGVPISIVAPPPVHVLCAWAVRGRPTSRARPSRIRVGSSIFMVVF